MYTKALKFKLLTLSFLGFSLLITVFVVVYWKNLSNRSKASQANNYKISYYNCSLDDPSSKLISYVIPGRVEPNKKFAIGLNIANCSGVDWNKETYKLITDNPLNNNLWGISFVTLPEIVPNNSSIDLQVEITSPNSAGSYVMQFAIAHNGLSLSPTTQPILVEVVSQSSLCNEVSSFGNTNNDAQPAIQACIDRSKNGSVIELPSGTYLIKNPIIIPDGKENISLTTQSTNSFRAPCLMTNGLNCAKLVASPNFPENGVEDAPLIKVGNSKGFTLSHIVIDGNKANRKKLCSESPPKTYPNIKVNTDGVKIFYNAVVNALCGTGLTYGGQNSTFAFNYVNGNGYHPSNWVLSPNNVHTVADGFSIVGGSHIIMNNYFRNNTDVDLILWGSAGSKIYFNTVIHDLPIQSANAGIMTSTDSVPSNKPIEDSLGNHVGTEISYNKIDCTKKACGYGIQLGLKTWSQVYPQVRGGIINNNVIRGTIVGINIDGSGTTNDPTTVGKNKMVDSGGVTSSTCPYPVTGAINKNPNDIVNFTDGQTAQTEFTWDCRKTINGVEQQIFASCYFDKNYCSTTPICNSFLYGSWGSCVNGIKERKIISQNTCAGGNGEVQLFEKCVLPAKTIKGGVFCSDKNLPINTGQIRPIKDAKVLITRDNQLQIELTTDNNGYFSASNIQNNFSIYVTDLSKAVDRNKVLGGSKNPYVVANGDAMLAKCNNGNRVTQGLSFLNCNPTNLQGITDGFAFVVSPCVNQNSIINQIIPRRIRER